MNTKLKIAAAGLALAFSLVSSNAFALVATNGSFALSQGGNTTATSSTAKLIGTGTTSVTVQNSPFRHLFSGFSDPYLANPNNLLSTNGGIINLTGPDVEFELNGGASGTHTFNIGALNNTVNISGSPLVLRVGNATTIAGSTQFYTFTFTSQVVTTKTNNGGTSGGTVSVYFLGDMTADTTNTFDLALARTSFVATFSNSADTGTISTSYSLDTPPAQLSIPEPALLGLMGIGIAGMTFARRKAIKNALTA